jgi:hypothetical protein
LELSENDEVGHMSFLADLAYQNNNDNDDNNNGFSHGSLGDEIDQISTKSENNSRILQMQDHSSSQRHNELEMMLQ